MQETQKIELEKPLERLIFDRISNDIVEGNKKGYYNYNDLNRIETWCKYLSSVLNNYNYKNKINCKLNWNMSSLPTYSELERIRKNILLLQESYFSFSKVFGTMQNMTIEKANIIEKILYEIDFILNGMENNFICCGVSNCGQDRIWQQRFRKSKIWDSQPYKISQYRDTDLLKTIATPNTKTITASTSILELTQIDKRDDIYASIQDINKSMKILDYLVGYECEYFMLKNLITDSSFENENWNGAIYSNTEKLYGNRSLFFGIGTTVVATINVERPILNHKYYGRRYIKTTGNNTPTDCRFELYGGDGDGLNWVFAWNQGDYPKWQFDSSIAEITAINIEESKQTIIRCFNVSATADTWIDGLMLIDLTETFGVGNEPTKDWCDTNIPYFDGINAIKIRKEIE